MTVIDSIPSAISAGAAALASPDVALPDLADALRRSEGGHLRSPVVIGDIDRFKRQLEV